MRVYTLEIVFKWVTLTSSRCVIFQFQIASQHHRYRERFRTLAYGLFSHAQMDSGRQCPWKTVLVNIGPEGYISSAFVKLRRTRDPASSWRPSLRAPVTAERAALALSCFLGGGLHARRVAAATQVAGSHSSGFDGWAILPPSALYFGRMRERDCGLLAVASLSGLCC